MPGPVVSLEWWRNNADTVVLADVRHYLDGRSAPDAYRAGHLPGARFVDFDRWLSQPADPKAGRNPLPDPETFAEGMRQLGLNRSSTLVAYDDEGGVIAARLVWMLRVTGHDARLLDGGLLAWTGPLVRGDDARVVEPGDFVASPWPGQRVVGIEDLQADGALLLDARNADRYRGDHDPVDPRPGHLPGARNLPCRSNLNPDGTLLPVAELRQRFQAVGVRTGAEVISYLRLRRDGVPQPVGAGTCGIRVGPALSGLLLAIQPQRSARADRRDVVSVPGRSRARRIGR